MTHPHPSRTQAVGEGVIEPDGRAVPRRVEGDPDPGIGGRDRTTPRWPAAIAASLRQAGAKNEPPQREGLTVRQRSRQRTRQR